MINHQKSRMKFFKIIISFQDARSRSLLNWPFHLYWADLS